MTLSIEVLPAPFGPMMARISPLRMSKETSLIAFTPPNDSETFSTDKQHLAGRDVGWPLGRSHAAFSMAARRPARSSRRGFSTRALIAPLRPSSKVTSVEMSASLEPS